MTQGIQSTAPEMTVQLKVALFRDIARRYGWESNAAIAKAIGVSRQQVVRVLDGTQPPTVAFIAGFLTAVPEAGFRRSFDIVPATDHRKEPTS